MAIVSDTDVRAFIGVDEDDAVLPFIHTGVERTLQAWIGWDVERATVTEYYVTTERGGDTSWFPGEFGIVPIEGGRSDVLRLKRKFVQASGLVVKEFAGAWMGQASSTAWETLDLGSEYILDLDKAGISRSGHLIRLGVKWPKSRGSVEVTYTAGFSAAELKGNTSASSDYTDASDLRLAVLMACQAAWNQAMAHRKHSGGRGQGILTGETIEGYSYTADAQASQALVGMANALPPAVCEILSKYRRYDLAI